MIRSILRAILGFALRLFFGEIEVAGSERLPANAPLIFVLNHPNALIDPLFLLCLAPRRVSFLAKAPLFRMPIVGLFVRALDSLPVYRLQDQNDPRENRATFEKARQILQGGGAIALFPEGTTHSDTRLRPFKTGAARIALGAAASGGRLYVVPAGLFYTDKRLFRSKALLYFGDPIAVEGQEEPTREGVRALSEEIREGLLAVTLNAENEEALAWIEHAERIFSDGQDESLADAFLLRRRFLDGYEWYQKSMPGALAHVQRRIESFESVARRAGIESVTAPRRESWVGTSLLALPATLGALVHWPLYRLIGMLAEYGGRKDRTVISTIKLGFSIVLFPLLWLAAGIWAGYLLGTPTALVVVSLCPPCGWSAVLCQERLQRLRQAIRVRKVERLDRSLLQRLMAERVAIREELVRLGQEQDRAGDVTAPT